MLKELFEAHFYSVYPKKKNKVLMLNERTAINDFSLIDPNACSRCRYICHNVPEKREQLRIHSNNNIYIISFDEVFSYVSKDVGEICDYMLENNDTTTMVEMTCSTSNNVIGKRQKARSQLYNTLRLLYLHPVIKKHIENHSMRYVVFSWKETRPKERNMDNVELTMKGMTVLTDAVYSPDNESPFSFDFKLKEIRYPDRLNC